MKHIRLWVTYQNICLNFFIKNEFLGPFGPDILWGLLQNIALAFLKDSVGAAGVDCGSRGGHAAWKKKDKRLSADFSAAKRAELLRGKNV